MTERGSGSDVGSIPISSPPDPDAPPVARTMDGHAAIVTMQSSPHNFLGSTLFAGLIEAMRWSIDVGARAVLLRSGLRNFCAGADVALFEGAVEGRAPELDVTELLRTFDELPVPIVAAVHGVCVGGGLEVALACDLVIAARSAKLGSVEATIGLNPLMGGIQRVTERAGAARAKEMAMLARRYDAATLERWNVINRVVPDEHLDEVAMTLVRELAHGPTLAHASTKAIVSHATAHGVASTDEAMGALQAAYWQSEDLRTGLASLQTNGPGAARFQGR